MNVLAFETATEACSVALHVDGRTLERYAVAPRRHAELALPWAQALLDEAGLSRRRLDAIAVGRGPGAFTGVRLAIGLAQGIALGLDLPVLPVSTLQALALRAPPQAERVLACIDARMGEVYAATYARQDGGWRPLQAERVCAPQEVQLPEDDARWDGVGTGLGAAEGWLLRRYEGRLASAEASALPRAADVLALALPALARGEGIAAERLEPAYLRNNVALTLAEQQARRAGAGG